MGKDVQLEGVRRGDAGPDRRDPGARRKAGDERAVLNGTVARYTGDPVNTLTGALVFLFTLAVYTITLNPSVPFWDAGEFIATSHILGVPHAPGTPLYVLIGRLFSMVPIESIAQRVNWISALSSAVAILFTYLVAVKVTRKMYPWEGNPFHRRIALLSGIVTALFAAFAYTFWDNAVEAEVYAPSCALTTFVVWLVLRWEERLDEGNEDGLLLIITYLVGLGVGIHLGVAVAAWAAVIYVFVVRPSYLRRWDYIGWALATLSLGVGVNALSFLVAPAVLGLTLLHWLVFGKLRKLALWSSGLFILGVSVHFFLIIRANLDPIINEAAPKTWDALWKMLIRDQYKPPPFWERKASFFGYQFPHMYLRYMWENFTLGNWARNTFAIPLLLAVGGVVAHFLRHRRTLILLGVLFLLLGPAMAYYLNFRVGEVRERDYFFVQNFQLLSIWVGIGAAAFLVWLRSFLQESGLRSLAVGGAASLLLAMSFLPLVHNFPTHDKRGFYLARDYAYNMLIGLEPNAIIFTNGDNDTFPLWYLQEVEGVRKDVRVVNLSLLNTGWYIKQLRDLEPRVPISWNDDQVDQLIPFRDRDGKIWMVKDIAVRHILETNRWKRPLYIGVTVPDQMGLEKHLTMEGLVFRIHPQETDERVDVAKTRHNLDDVYRYQGLIVKDGDKWRHDTSVHKDDNTQKLVQNYAAAASRVALELFRQGRREEALAEMEKAEAVSPYFPAVAVAKGVILEELGRVDEALAFYKDMMQRYPHDWQLHLSTGQLLLRQNRDQEALAYLQKAMELAPADEFYPYQALTGAYYNAGLYEQAVDVLERWLVLHPEDQEVRSYMVTLRQAMQNGSLRQGEAPAKPDTTVPDSVVVPLQESN